MSLVCLRRTRRQPSIERLECRSLLALTPVGAVFDVSSTTNTDEPRIAATGDGEFVAVWRDSVDGAVLAQRFDDDGTKIGGEIDVSVDTEGFNHSVTVDSALDGSFVVVWVHSVTDEQGDSEQLMSRSFDADGEPTSDETPLTELDTLFYDVAVSVASDGEYAVAYTTADEPGGDNSLRVALFDADGEEVDNILVAEGSPSSSPGPQDPDVVLFDSGEFLVTWRDTGVGGRLRRFDAAGNPEGDLVSLPGFQTALAGSADGRAVVVWNDLATIQARLFAASGAQVGSDLEIADIGANPDLFLVDPAVDMDVHGNFVIAWERGLESQTGTFNERLFVRLFAASGAAAAAAVEVDQVEGDEDDVFRPDVALIDDGRIAVAYESVPEASVGIEGRIFQLDDEPQPGDDGEFDDDYIADLYLAVLGRAGSQAEIDSWLGTPGITAHAAVQGFLHSREYFTNLVRDFYQDFLGRTADAGGLNFWVDLLISGRREEEVAAHILASPEYFQRRGGENSAFVEGLYLDVLGRAAGAAEVEFWVDQLGDGRTRFQVASSFLASVEFRGLLVSDVDDDLSFAGWYQDYFQRNAEPAGRDYWAQQLAINGNTWRSVQTSLLLSEEFFIG